MGALGMQLASAGYDIGMGMINNEMTRAMNAQNTKRQVKASKELSDYQYQLEMKKWEETGYKGQMRQLKEAGLNPAMMYGMGGGGGQSSAVGSGGSVGLGDGSKGMSGMGMQVMLMKAQKENIEADTEKKEVEANKLKGVDSDNVQTDTELKRAQTGNVQADTKLKEIEQRTEEMAAQVAEETLAEAKGLVRYNMQKTQQEVNELVAKNWITRASGEEQIKAFRLQNLETITNIALKEAQKNNTVQMTEESKAQVRKWTQEILNEFTRLAREGRMVDAKEFENMVKDREQRVDQIFKEGLIEQGQWHNFIQGMNGVMQMGTRLPIGTKPGGSVGFPRH